MRERTLVEDARDPRGKKRMSLADRVMITFQYLASRSFQNILQRRRGNLQSTIDQISHGCHDSRIVTSPMISEDTIFDIGGIVLSLPL